MSEPLDIEKALLAALKMLESMTSLDPADAYEKRKVLRDDLGHLIVSTAYTTDFGYETAIVDQTTTHPVQRYASYQEAVDAHPTWVTFAQTLKEGSVITELGIPGILEPTKVTLRLRTTDRKDQCQ